MSYKPTLYIPLEIVDKIYEITSPLKVTLQNIIKNPHVQPQFKQTALLNFQCVENLRNTADEVAYTYRLKFQSNKPTR